MASEPEGVDSGAAPPAAVFLFEVSGHSAFQPWCVQRGLADFAHLHKSLTYDLRGAPLPKLPEEKISRVGKVFKSRQERKVNALAEELETYLNTVLLLPAAQGSPILQEFLEVPCPVMEEEPLPAPSVAELRGAAAADAVVDAAGSVCQTFRSFCDGLVGRASARQQDFTSSRSSGTNISLQDLYAECLEDQPIESREDILRRHVAARRRNSSMDSGEGTALPHEGSSPPARVALNLPTNIKVKEWK